MIIYKYAPSPFIFENFELRFSQRDVLNDPAELAPDILLRDPAHYARGILNRNISAVYFRLLFTNPTLPPQEVWRRCSVAALDVERRFEPTVTTRKIYDDFMRVTNRNVGILSLTEDPCSAPMWWFYASEYTGLVIGFDSNDDFFHKQPKDPKVCGDLIPVTYTNNIPIVCVDVGTIDIPNELFFTKTEAWKYEKEWRMLKLLSHANNTAVDKSGETVYLFKVPPSAIREVIFGYRMDTGIREKVKQALQAHASHVLLKEIVFEPGEGLQAVDCR